MGQVGLEMFGYNSLKLTRHKSAHLLPLPIDFALSAVSEDTFMPITGQQRVLRIMASAYPKIDDELMLALPSNGQVLSISPSGTSEWVNTYRIEYELEGGSISDYFLKIKLGNEGRLMMKGSFESECLFHHYSPLCVPKPIAWGCYRSDPDIWYYLCEFYDMLDEIPEPQDFVSSIVDIHKKSMGNSPTGMYGFQVPTHLANIPNDNTWQISWEAWFTQAMRQMFSVEEKVHGKSNALECLKIGLYDKVIPRLLRPLETGDRAIQPCLIHSDLWPGNCMPDAGSNRTMIFDSCAFWGHNEADLGTWRAPRYRMGHPFLREYQEKMGISEPKEDWDDRNALYALRYDLLVSALYPNDLRFRNMAITEMQRLLDKYPVGYEGRETRLGE